MSSMRLADGWTQIVTVGELRTKPETPVKSILSAVQRI
jgi:hypothetical protein